MPFSLLDIGVKEDMSRTEIRKYRLTNFVLTVLFVLGLILLIPSLYENGFIVSAYMNLASVALMAVLLFINHFGYINFTRLVASIYPSVIIVSASIVVKTVYPQSVVIFDFFFHEFSHNLLLRYKGLFKGILRQTLFHIFPMAL